ncbi:T9SS type B sorting domain-containing protein [Flavobacterium sp. AG291]|uniref:T9SS type B sorting domain-containing protein n=1 Tax=Flavobacterium sp. AG291 TaxID=2184000 RepID=UPI000E0CA3E5|nr:T9SS type B sorting domain-containing protein [Flavobacterium sp. AG291]RDI09862.1 gliding motility-associated-like protein [Flavobacterium sp. AG291]
MKNIASIILLLLTINMFGQKEANNWQFGLFTGIHFEDDGSVTSLSSSIESNEGCSSISDNAGNLLFYTDGRNVWDRNNVLMPNGNYNAGTGLMGDPSSTQSGVIVPKKGDPDIYYIFTVDEPHHQNAAVYPNQFPGPYEDGSTVPSQDDGYNNGFNYSIVDLSVIGSNGSIGDVVTRNTHLVTYVPDDPDQIKYKCSEKVTAVKNRSGSGYWVITHFVNRFYAFEVTSTGVNPVPVISTLIPVVPVSGYRRNSIGCIKASPNGKKVAIAHVQISTLTGSTQQNGSIWLYDFNNETGILSNPLAISQDTMPYGVEFSQKTKKLYVSYDNSFTNFGGIHQYDLESDDIPGSDVFIAASPQSATLQLGPNGKIYRAVVNSPTLDVINNPDADGLLCNYVTGGVSLSTGTCYFGLPHFITSYFAVNIIASNKCFGNITHFELDTDDDFTTVAWDFGDGQTSAASAQNTVSHTYTSVGTYTVTATINHQGEIHTETIDITITTTPTAYQADNLEECDPDNDGITVFNLSQNNSLILGSQLSTENTVKYFDNKENADANVNAINATAYVNTVNPQRIYARIHNSINPECFQLTSFLVSTLNSPVVDETVNETICLNNPEGLTLKAINTNPNLYTYLWSTGETTSKITVYQAGTYIVKITNQLGCSNTKTFVVTASDLAIVTDVIVNDMRDNNTVTIMAEPPQGVETTYVYSLDAPNGPFQESNYFERLTSGIHTVYIKDTKGCGIKAEEITVLDTPKFFTPNGDGVNDYWNIIGINANFYPNSKIYIFDRYGKLLADVDPKGIGWDGIFEGRSLPSNDYWFVLKLDNGRIIKGHFSLMR